MKCDSDGKPVSVTVLFFRFTALYVEENALITLRSTWKDGLLIFGTFLRNANAVLMYSTPQFYFYLIILRVYTFHELN